MYVSTTSTSNYTHYDSTGTDSGSSSNYGIWNCWTNYGTSSYTSTTTRNVWDNWSCGEVTTCYNGAWYSWTPIHISTPVAPPQPVVETSRAEIIAEAKANKLLQLIVGKTQWKIYKKTGKLLVHGKDFDYLIYRNGKVTRIEKDKLVDLCIHLRDRFTMPPTDNVIALALMAASDDYTFNSMANFVDSRPIGDLPEAACM